MVKSVVREHHWSPNILGDLFIDNADYLGLEFWYDDVNECIKELKKKNK